MACGCVPKSGYTCSECIVKMMKIADRMVSIEKTEKETSDNDKEEIPVIEK